MPAAKQVANNLASPSSCEAARLSGTCHVLAILAFPRQPLPTFTFKKSVEPTIWLCFQQGFSFGDEFTIHSCAQHAKHSSLTCAPRSSMFRRATRGTRSSPSRHSFWESQKTPPPPPFAQSRPSQRLVQHVAVLVGGLRRRLLGIFAVGLGLPNQSGHARAKKYQEYVFNNSGRFLGLWQGSW